MGIDKDTLEKSTPIIEKKEECKLDIDEAMSIYRRIQEDKETQSTLQKMMNGDAVNIIAFLCIIGVFGYIYGVTFFTDGISENHLRFVDQSLGNLYGILNTVIGFYCGNVYSKMQSTKK